ncbi:MORN repeat-containing protein [Uliginosibacterium aquaticum]|uniref:MORN repeat-containing protein n=1 Tax=Uliginosibacterium aquaticum TaxID=2731212 RepID=A0ABX2IJM0_9RHOO|nr:hypothetical protein [Uliginosibacterium aquaticum]NSL54240.1 hypothetical protein [Uliginosibacterium aquaticum]
MAVRRLILTLLFVLPGLCAAQGAVPLPPEQSVRASDALFTGRFVIDPQTQLITGELTIKWDNGNRYSGQMRAGKRHGQGRFDWANGQSYDGDWQDDQATGKARIVYANGDRYEGACVAGLRQGGGRMQWTNGQSYEGDWAGDQPEGRGVLLFANGDRYSGEVRQGLPQGQGSKLFAATGDRYEGQFDKGLAQGEGRYTWPTGDQYVGQWQQGRKHGKGRYTWVNGDYWEGLFREDLQAEGRLYFVPTIKLDQESVNKLMQQARAASDSFAVRPGSTEPERALDIERLAAIAQVAAELEVCRQPAAKPDCRATTLAAIAAGRHFEHDWQNMFAEKGVSYDVDRRSSSEAGVVFSWFRFADFNANLLRHTGIKYDCRSQALEIQLIYNCNGKACSLDKNFDRYVGKTIPAATIKGWFKGGCERRR